MFRQIVVDAAVGAAAFLLVGAVLLLQGVSMRAVEILLIVLPALLFPIAIFLRARRPSRRAVPLFVISAWCVAAFIVLARIANADLSSLALPIALCLGGCVVAAFTPRLSAVGIVILFAAALALAEPMVWSGMLTRQVHIIAPDVALLTADGAQIRLSRLRGDVVVLNFWGVWCGPCVRELPELDAVSREDTAGTRFFAVNSGLGGENKEQVAAFVAGRHVAIPVAYDFDRRVYKAFGVSALPTTVIIDPSGMIRYKRIGFASTANFASWLRRSIRAVR